MAEAREMTKSVSELLSIDSTCKTFEVTSNETVLTVEGCLSFEAAVKMAFVLLEAGKLEGNAVVNVSGVRDVRDKCIQI